MNVNIDIKWLDPKKLKPNPRNRNKHPKEQINRLAKLLEYQGWRLPIIVSNRSGMIVAGHGRLMAAKKLKMNQVPVCYQDFDDEDQEYAFLISDNAISEWAELQLDDINKDLAGLDGMSFDLDLLGMRDFQLSCPGDNNSDDAGDTSEKDIKDEHGEFVILLNCEDEEQQEELYSEMNKRKIKCKIL